MHPLAAELQGILGPDSIRTVGYDPVIRTPFYRMMDVPQKMGDHDPFTIVKVETAEQIARILTLANQQGEAVCVRQGMGFLSPDVVRPDPPGTLCLDLSRMKGINPNFERNYVEIGPAVTEIELNNELAAHGYAFPEFIGPVTWAGSLVSLNTSGRSVDPNWGKPRDYVMGLQAVLPTGEIVETGSKGIRASCGFDLGQLLIGAQCLFGVITQIRLRLVPATREVAGAVVRFPSLKAVGEGVKAMYTSRAPYPLRMELMDRKFLDLMEFDGPRPQGLVLLEADGDAPGEAGRKLGEIIKVLEDAAAAEAHKPDAEEWQRLLDFRESTISKLIPKGLLLLVGEVMDCPLDILPGALEDIRRMQERIEGRYPGLTGYIVGHIGGGNFHPFFAVPVELGYDRLRQIATEIREEILEYKLASGATTGEQGLFPGHREWFLRSHSPEHWNVLQAIKKAMDPNNVLNPLRLTP